MNYEPNILIVDDEIGILNLLEITLKKENFHNITSVLTKKEALLALKKHHFDIILLDVMLPDGEGFQLCSEIRLQTSAPILFISARSSDFDKLTGLSAGADDYITKPFNPLEVVARIQAILRRKYVYEKYDSHAESEIFTYESMMFSPEKASLVVEGQKVSLTSKELDLLYFFCKHPNLVFTTAEIYKIVWGENFGDEKTVTIHINKLRKKLGDSTRNSKIIVNLRGIGYKFAPPSGEVQ